MGRVTVTVNDRATVTRSEVFLPAAETHPAWVRGNTPPKTKIGRDLGPEATRARVFNNGIDDLDVPPDTHDRKDDDFYDTSHVGDVCSCREPDEAAELASHSLEKLADIEELRFFTHTDDSVPAVRLSIPLLIRCLEWAREKAKTDEALHELVELLTQEAKGDKVLDMQDYAEP